MQIGSAIGTGVKALAFAALNRFDTLNSLVNRMTGGSINRDTLAQKVLRDAVHMGLESQFARRGLAERSATLVPLAGKVLYGNNAGEMSASIKDLTCELILTGQDRGFAATLGTVGLAETLAHTVTEDKFIDKLLATMLKQHSFETLEAYMEKSLAGMPFKGFAGELVKNVLQRAVVDQPGLDQSERPVFRLLANLGNDFLSNRSHQQSVGEYFQDSAQAAPLDALHTTFLGVGLATIDAVGSVVDSVETLANGYSDTKNQVASGEYRQAGLTAATAVTKATVQATLGMAVKVAPTLGSAALDLGAIGFRTAVGIGFYAAPSVQAGATTLYQGALAEAGRIYDTAAGPPAYQLAADVFSKDIDQAGQDDKPPALPPPDARTSDSQWANALIRQQVATQFGLPGTPPTSAPSVDAVDLAFEKGQIDAERREALLDLADRFSPAQLSPLGPFSATQQVAHNVVSGNLARVSCESRAGLRLAERTTAAMTQALDPSPVKSSDKAGYKLADTYAPHVGKLALDFPEGVYGYADASRDNLQGAGNLWWGENITLADRAELRKLYNTCGGNEPQMLAVSSYLNPEMAYQALSVPVLAELDPQASGRLQLRQPEPAGLQLQLADDTPQYRYQLRREGENVQVTVSATWDVTHYGTDAQQLRRPHGAPASQLTASVTITVPANGPARHSVPALQCAIRNESQFSTHGQLAASATQASPPADISALLSAVATA